MCVGHRLDGVQIAPTKVRGSLGSINQLVICIGIVAALVVNVVIPATSWRTMFYLASIPPILLALGEHVSPLFSLLTHLHVLSALCWIWWRKSLLQMIIKLCQEYGVHVKPCT